jgi:hypothetical protein
MYCSRKKQLLSGGGGVRKVFGPIICCGSTPQRLNHRQISKSTSQLFLMIRFSTNRWRAGKLFSGKIVFVANQRPKWNFSPPATFNCVNVDVVDAIDDCFIIIATSFRLVSFPSESHDSNLSNGVSKKKFRPINANSNERHCHSMFPIDSEDFC